MRSFKTFAGHTGTCSCQVHARGQDDDRRQIVADLISNAESPFMPDDEDSLRMMSEITLRQLRNRYAAPKAHQLRHHNENDPALVAMVAPSSLNVYLAQSRSRDEPVVDVVLLAQQRAARNLEAMTRGTLPNETGARGRDLIDATDAEIAAMSAPSSLAVFRETRQTQGRK